MCGLAAGQHQPVHRGDEVREGGREGETEGLNNKHSGSFNETMLPVVNS